MRARGSCRSRAGAIRYSTSTCNPTCQRLQPDVPRLRPYVAQVFDEPPAATCHSTRAQLLQRWRRATPRCAALRKTTPRAGPRRRLPPLPAAAAMSDLTPGLTPPQPTVLPVLLSPKVHSVLRHVLYCMVHYTVHSMLHHVLHHIAVRLSPKGAAHRGLCECRGGGARHEGGAAADAPLPRGGAHRVDPHLDHRDAAREGPSRACHHRARRPPVGLPVWQHRAAAALAVHARPEVRAAPHADHSRGRSPTQP